MKLIMGSLLLFAFAAQAEVPEYWASQHTCDELKAELENYKSIQILRKVLFIRRRATVELKANCNSEFYTTHQGVFRTIDTKRCVLGEFCKSIPTYSDYSSDYSSSDWGSSTGHGSSWGSSDPPSSGDRGPSYNPPASGTRGPRYCPGC